MLKDILNAEEILLLIAAKAKHNAVENYLAATVTITIPDSFLWLHRNVSSLIDGSQYPDK
ncbi:hypothetical protein [Citrobacter sp.]|uniref:hypothetical protein n=1 Tax=Citrobacter sp. TaxID=1896336 RepID=UPI0028FE464D|nr:hypothetical protein [Citrobacter sp.]MDU1876109.1 hypothetical protein [Citrobacter sp.]